MDHQEIDARSLAMHTIIAERLKANPLLLEKAKSNIARWRPMISPASHWYLDEWEKILNNGLDATVAAATDPSERGNAMRQSNPFPGILSEEERLEFLRQWRLDHPHKK